MLATFMRRRIVDDTSRLSGGVLSSFIQLPFARELPGKTENSRDAIFNFLAGPSRFMRRRINPTIDRKDSHTHVG
jgi:hypothetical protein